MSATILALGTALPPLGVSQETSAEMSAPLCCTSQEEHRLFHVLYRRSKVRSRRSVLLEKRNGSAGIPGADPSHTSADVLSQSFFSVAADEQDMGPSTRERMARYAELAGPLAEQAATAALREATIDPASIDHLITVSCTGFAAPGLDGTLIRSLGLSPQVSRTNVGFMGCHGAFNGLRIASALASGSPGRPQRALVCAVELCSLHFAYGWNPQRIVANSLFADGAGAVVVSSESSEASGAWHLKANGSVVLAESADAMSWTITNHGFEMTLSPRVPELIEHHLRPWLEAWLARFDLTIDSIGSWAAHPGGPRILQAVHSALGLPAGALHHSHEVLAEYGNMSSPTILFILDRLRKANAPRPCVALGFGPGLAVEAMLFV